MRKLFLDELPKRKYGNNKRIDWVNSVGYKVKFIYDEIEDELEIINYYRNNNIGYLDIKYKNKLLSVRTNVFLKCCISEILDKRTKQYKYNIGDIIETNTGKIQILEQKRILLSQNYKGYKYKCLIDGNIDEIFESSLIKGVGCNVCSGRKIIKGINDLWTTHPEVAKLLKYPERGYEISYGNNNSEIFICPYCGYEKPQIVLNITRRNFSCPKCGDGISYPNKFVRSFLNQLNEEYIPEYYPEWAFIKHKNFKLNGKKRYDNYLPNKNEVWEIHGIQHYEESFKSINDKLRTLKEEQENDKIKKELAESNNLKYIIVDARYSDSEYIKNSILNLPEIKRYDLSLIDWYKCHEYACNSMVKVACDLWNNGIKNTVEIGNIMRLTYPTIIRYLKQGSKLGWCDYKFKTRERNKSIIQLNLNNEFIKEWETIKEIKETLKIYDISNCCKNKPGHYTAGGFRWMYKDNWELMNQNKS